MSDSRIPATVQPTNEDDQARRFIADMCERRRSDLRELNERFAGLAEDDDGGRATWAKDAAQLIGLWFDDETTRRCIERWANLIHDRLAETFGPQIAACVASPEARQGVLEPHPSGRNAYNSERMILRWHVQQQVYETADTEREMVWRPTPPAALYDLVAGQAGLPPDLWAEDDCLENRRMRRARLRAAKSDSRPARVLAKVRRDWLLRDQSERRACHLQPQNAWDRSVALTERIHERLVTIQDEAFRIQADRWWRIVACYKRHHPGGDRHELRLVGYLPSLFDGENDGGSFAFQNTDVEAVHADLTAVVELASRTVGPAECAHNEDFTWVRWYGTEYRFTRAQQATVIRLLWTDWEAGGGGLTQKRIAEEIGSDADYFRLKHVFRSRDRESGEWVYHHALGSMVGSAGKGGLATFTLCR